MDVTPITNKPLEIQAPKESGDSSAFDSRARMQLKPIGASGTDINAGYFSEEYLHNLRGRRGAKVFDEMRRSESQVAMLINAVTNPIKAGTWEFEAADVNDGEAHKDLVEYCLKEMIDWETFLHEALTCIFFGYSMFEVINNVVFNHPKFGTFNGLRALAFRSQKTIERWNLQRETGDLVSVEQWVMGDTRPLDDVRIIMDARFLLVMTLQKEGDNYEGISALRPMYGPWFRKNLYLKIVAIGVEKAAIGTPIGTVPSGKPSDEVENFKTILQNFTAHESAYLVKPEGWEVEIVKNDFDATEVKELIIMENTEMINSLVANFLALGTSGTGSFALGTDLSDFFLTGIQNYANLICGVINRKLIPDLIKLNFGEQESYPKLRATGINDKAGKELAEVLTSLAQNKLITPDMKLEEYLRKAFSLPKKDDATAHEVTPQDPALGLQFHERQILLAETYKKEWNSARDAVKVIMQENLLEILEGLKAQAKTSWAKSTPAQRRAMALSLEPKSLSKYKIALREALAKVANEALISARRETPKAAKKNIKLSEAIKLAAPTGGYYAALPEAIRNIISNQAGLIAATQAQDINKGVSFQFMTSADVTDNVDQVFADIDDIMLPMINDGVTSGGMSLDAAAGNSVSTAYNQARLEWFFDPEVLETIESFTFFNEDPQSEICQELDGTTWAVGDPDIDRFTPPLHHNCKSRLVPNEKGDKGNPEINRGGTAVSQKGLDAITLSEPNCKCSYHLNLSDVSRGLAV